MKWSSRLLRYLLQKRILSWENVGDTSQLHPYLCIYLLNIFIQGRTYRQNHCFTMLPCTV